LAKKKKWKNSNQNKRKRKRKEKSVALVSQSLAMVKILDSSSPTQISALVKINLLISKKFAGGRNF